MRLLKMDKKLFEEYMRIFLEQNSKINLLSKNDEQFLWEKHIFDSLAIERFFDKYDIKDLAGKQLLDIGTGGGFPSVPVAIKHPELKVTALDSIHKKINAIIEMKTLLNLKNLETVCDRAENIKDKKFDYITLRAVTSLKKFLPIAIPLLKKNGFLIAYKSVKVNEEIDEAKFEIEKYSVKITDIIPYNLPLKENYTRNLVIIQK